MIQYFENLTSENEIKARYKELAKMHHPDRGGDVEIMKQINAQYETVITGCYQKAGKSITEIDELLANDMQLHAKLNEILGLDNIFIEICGSWIWVTGDTASCKEHLKKAGYFWASKKTAWYYRNDTSKSRSRKKYSLDEIRERHGQYVVNKRLCKIA